VPDTVLVVAMEAEADEEEEDEQDVEFLIWTPTPLHTPEKALMALWTFASQFWQMYCSTAVALLPLQTAFRLEGSACVFTPATRHAGGVATARRAATANSVNTVIVFANMSIVVE